LGGVYGIKTRQCWGWWAEKDKNIDKIGLKIAPKKWARGPPGRGVLRFSARAYRNSVHFLPFFRIFSIFLQI